jgi:gamma-glutamylcyclotransferase (GGCT)/AIG2-like uncharacterized protein YtfP
MKYYIYIIIFILICIFIILRIFNKINIIPPEIESLKMISSGVFRKIQTQYIFFYGTLRKNQFNYKRVKDNPFITYIGEGITENKFSFGMIAYKKTFPFITNQKYTDYEKINVIGDLYKFNDNISFLEKIKFFYKIDNLEFRYDRKIIKVGSENHYSLVLMDFLTCDGK